jgi:hypothetical protein
VTGGHAVISCRSLLHKSFTTFTSFTHCHKCTLLTRPLVNPGFVKKIMPYLSDLYYNGTLVT